MRITHGLAAALGTALVLVPASADTSASRQAPVDLAVTPGELEVTAGLPCLPADPLTVTMTNAGAEDLFADTFLRADDPLELTRGMYSSYLPSGYTGTAEVTVSAPHGTEPGSYAFTADLADSETAVDVPVTVVAPPDKTPGTNLLLGEQAEPSTTYVTSSTEFNPCGAVDGDRTWSAATAWNSATRGEFPDSYTVKLPEPTRMNRVDLYTAKSASSSPETHGLRDWDVRVQSADGEWTTVAEVRGNTAWLTSSTFESIEATAVQIVGLASNGDDYSRIAELEAYNDETVTE